MLHCVVEWCIMYVSVPRAPAVPSQEFVMQVETVRALIARGTARHPELASRLERAAFIALFRHVGPELDGSWTVGSEHDPGKTYRVQLDAASFCTCQDSQHRPGQECKHSLAAVMVARALVGLERHPLFDRAAAGDEHRRGAGRRRQLPCRRLAARRWPRPSCYAGSDAAG